MDGQALAPKTALSVIIHAQLALTRPQLVWLARVDLDSMETNVLRMFTGPSHI